jgi:hypothetical protein
MKYKRLFADTIYDSDRIDSCPLVITWAATDMWVEDGNAKSLAISAKTTNYKDSFKVTEEFFEDALQAYFLFPDTKEDDDEDSSNLRFEFVKALLNK